MKLLIIRIKNSTLDNVNKLFNKEKNSRPFFALPNSKTPRVLVPIMSKKLFKAGFTIHNTASHKNRFIKKALIEFSPFLQIFRRNVTYGSKAFLNLLQFMRDYLCDKVVTASFYIGTSGSINQKLTMKLFRRDGTSPGIVKIAIVEEAREFISYEFENLKKINQLQFVRIETPKKIELNHWGNDFFLFQENVFLNCEDSSLDLSETIVAASQELGAKTLNHSNSDETLERLFEECRGFFPDKERLYVIKKLLKSVRKANLPTVLIHGDFLPYNIKIRNNGIVLIDWEFSRTGFPLSDLFHFIIQGGAQIKNSSSKKLLEFIFSNTKNHLFFNLYLDSLNLPNELCLDLFNLYLLETLIFEKKINPNNNLEDSVFYILFNEVSKNKNTI